jgi:hypothetical protein
VKIGNAHFSLQHFTSLPATSALAKPAVSHIGQMSRTVFPLAGRGDSGMARLLAASSTPKGSSESPLWLAAGDFVGADFTGAAGATATLSGFHVGAAERAIHGIVIQHGLFARRTGWEHESSVRVARRK